MSRLLVCSIAPEAFPAPRHYNMSLKINGPQEGSAYSETWFEDDKDYINVLDGWKVSQRIEVPIPAETVVRDILKAESPLYANTLEDVGVWVCPSGKPSKKEIADAQARRRQWLNACLRKGDEMFAKGGPAKADQIPQVCKNAVDELGEKREWTFFAPPVRQECEGCGTQVNMLKDGSKPAWCSVCGSVLDADKANRLSPGKLEPAGAGKAAH